MRGSFEHYEGNQVITFASSYKFRLYRINKWFGLPVVYGVLSDIRTDSHLLNEISADLKNHLRAVHTQLGVISPTVTNITSDLEAYLKPQYVTNTVEYGITLGFVGNMIVNEMLPPPPAPLTPFGVWDIYDKTYYVKANGQHGVFDYADGDVATFFSHVKTLNL